MDTQRSQATDATEIFFLYFIEQVDKKSHAFSSGRNYFLKHLLEIILSNDSRKYFPNRQVTVSLSGIKIDGQANLIQEYLNPKLTIL